MKCVAHSMLPLQHTTLLCEHDCNLVHNAVDALTSSHYLFWRWRCCCCRTLQTSNEIINRGYSAVYYLNSTGHYVLAASVLRELTEEDVTANGKKASEYAVDVPLER
jgi:hypothetical protein